MLASCTTSLVLRLHFIYQAEKKKKKKIYIYMQPENETNMPLEVMSEYSSMGILAFSTVQLNNMHKKDHISLKKMQA